jgi:hypothetical protein
VPEWAVLTLRIALAVAGDNSIDADQQFVGRWARAAEAVTDTVLLPLAPALAAEAQKPLVSN